MNIKRLFLPVFITVCGIAIATSMYSFHVYRKASSSVFPLGSSYKREWNKVDSLVRLGLSKSALEEVELIYQKANLDANSAQIIKAIMFRLRLEQQFKENDLLNSILRMNDEIRSSSYPLTPVLHSMLAELYTQYYRQNRWKFSQRSEVVNVNMTDISTWDLKTLFDEIIKQHLLALKDAEKLKHTPVNIYEDVLNNSNDDGRRMRPTLYDFIAHRAVDFFISEEPDVIRPAYKFLLNSEDYFKSYDNFAKITIPYNGDSLSTKYYAIKLLQGLIAFHAEDSDPEALIDADRKRLEFVKKYATTGINDSLYLNALQALEQKFIAFPSSTQVSYDIANVYLSKGNNYDPRISEDNKWYAKKAVDVCEAAQARFKESYGAQECAALEIGIKKRALTFTLEKANLINMPLRGYLSYTNINKVYVRVVPIDIKLKNLLHKKQDDFITACLTVEPVKLWTLKLPDDDDYKTHYIEIKIPALPAGLYAILLSPDSTFSFSGNAVVYSTTLISNLSFIDRKTPDGGHEYYVLDRETGKPIKGAETTLWEVNYNRTTQEDDYIQVATKESDAEGYVEFAPQKNDYRRFVFEIKKGADNYRTDDIIRLFTQTEQVPVRNMRTLTKLFTDRAIYRPGQTIYFKGIMIQTDGSTNEIVRNQTSTVTFYDVNSQKIASLNLTTNSYGSYSGTFIAPEGVLNGTMRIADGYGSVNVQVEDYKRPKFEVVFAPVSGTYRLGDSVRISGTAKSYSGADIDGAEVKYRVVRNANFPHWYYYRRGYMPTSAEMEISNGMTSTNDTGGYFVRFKAISDQSISKSSKPTYVYTIYADVTDINGETHSSQVNVSVAYNALNLNVTIPDKIDKDKEQELKITTTNTNGVTEPAQVNVQVFRKKEPERIFRSRLWSKPDKFLMTKEEYYASFPKDEYDDENNIYTWERGEKVFENSFVTQKDKGFTIPNLSLWKPGNYVLEAHAKDRFGEDVKDIKYFTLYSEKEQIMPDNSPDWFTAIKDNGAPGEKASFIIGSKENDVKVLYEIAKQGKPVIHEWLTINNEQKVIAVPIEESDRGGFSLDFVFVKSGRQYIHNAAVKVPYKEKGLDLLFETFRNKLLPGEKEEWKIKIRNKQGDKVMAEMMATLYDASLDAFKANAWNWNLATFIPHYPKVSWGSSSAFGINNSSLYSISWNPPANFPSVKYKYDQLNWFGYHLYSYYGNSKGFRTVSKAMSGNGGDNVSINKMEPQAQVMSANAMADMNATGNEIPGILAADSTISLQKEEEKTDLSNVITRTNFNETAFFYPQLETDSSGSVIISFTVPEALTKWKMMGLAYTKELEEGEITNSLVTQKDLMVVPNAPRFFRENDKIEFTSKVTDLADKVLAGEAQLQLFDAITMKPVNLFAKAQDDGLRSFSIKKGMSKNLTWNLSIPEGIEAISYKVVAKAGDFSDGEEMAVPVLTNHMLVTESMPLPIRGKQTKTFTFSKFINQNNGSTTLRNHKLTFEFTSNPAWYAVQALPYMMEYPYNCSEQVLNRFYANSIAFNIANSSPKIKAVFDSWKNATPDALLSNLEKNQDLKSLMLEETPWVLDAKNESERKRRVALLFDLNNMSNELEHALTKLEKMQLPDGGWPWFEQMPDDRYITQYIITGIGHLDHLGIRKVRDDNNAWNMVKMGIRYLDINIDSDYVRILRYRDTGKNNLGYEDIQYLYARSFFRDIPLAPEYQTAFDYFKYQEQEYWLSNGRYMQGMIALALNRYNDKITSGNIMKSLKENSITSDEMGMYWKENYNGFSWWEAPIESQALLIEAFDEVAQDEQSVDALKVWLLKSKQTQNWKTTKATAEACYALLLRGTDWLSTESNVEITLGNTIIDPKNMPDVKQEAGTGYFKTSWSGNDIKMNMGNVTITKNDEGVSWGALYWQYFEQLDKITSSKTPLQLIKKLSVERNTASGPVIELIDSATHLKVGDKIKVRIELRVDRDMQYVHMKDMRASGFEPLNVISAYKYQDGLGYYESTTDAATNFFISYLRKGTYVFEYPLYVTHNGNFSNGITSIQCMYAPEFTSNSEGIRVSVGK